LLVDFIVGSKSRNIPIPAFGLGEVEEADAGGSRIGYWNKVAVIIDRLHRFSVSFTS
jgi:hypothetical protein